MIHSSKCNEFDEIQNMPKAAGDLAINKANTTMKQPIKIVLAIWRDDLPTLAAVAITE